MQSPNYRLFRSLLLKMAMLGATVGLVLWIGWPLPSPENRNPASLDSHERGGAATVRADGAAGQSRGASGQPVVASKLDLNHASIEELTHLPGIGQVLAERIIKRRQNNGLYKSVEDLLEVKGIGRKRLKRLRSLILVSTNPRPPQAITGQPPQSPQTDGRTS